ncbi:primosomal protein N' [Thiorhodovibrio frisius]|uniref:Replication restart protein PriA n=1 Tax=Thiorhodovibrio frisius TaxID=631362 RepID=H8YZ47_9GAMM|nr:primosomal protein N' [Thiorhodovibrio frisius]EIC21974.1 primosomal protein N'' [Thiorhodovibrio frisius]WPL24263.1 Primosomal protein N' [Thiorhodovibrio frisius]
MKPARDGPAILQVAVAAPLPELFDYLPLTNGDTSPKPQPGMRVLVPFGRGRRVGMIVGIAADSDLPPERLKGMLAILDQEPLLQPADLEFILWSARYYRAAPGEALFTALPTRLRRPEPAQTRNLPGWRLTAAGQTTASATLNRAPRQRATIDYLHECPAGVSQRQLNDALGACGPSLRALAERGLIEPCQVAPPALVPQEADEPPAPAEMAPTPELNPQQAEAVAAVRASQGFAGFLLDGITGSGKTEVYLRLIGDALDLGCQILILVPEIGLTPQLEQRLRARIPAPMVVLHSGLSEREREERWFQGARGRARVLLGTRSAIFAPLPELALIIVDEEHDLSLKQQDGFRYSARDLAVRRAQLCDCPVILGSATPSLESLHNCERGRYQRLVLSHRAGQAQAPRVQVADIRGQYLDTGMGPLLLQRIEERINQGEQVLLFLNRRGFSPVLTCHDCGWISECIRCDARLTIHRNRSELRCHHCGLIRPLPARCPYCEGPDLRPLGQGTERVEDSLRQRFPGIPLARIDRDSTSRKGELERLLAGALNGEFRILLGTQMLAKGHHLPGITLVGILDLDHGLYGADFRATERMAQLLVQVAGRAGRAEKPGTVILQTRHPHHPMLRALLERGYGAFARAALAERRAAGMPPFSYQVLIRADSPREEAAMAFLQQAATQARELQTPDIELWGPAPAAMEQRAGRHRAQLLLQAPERAPLHRLLERLLPRLRALPRPRELRFSLDVDPQETL